MDFKYTKYLYNLVRIINNGGDHVVLIGKYIDRCCFSIQNFGNSELMIDSSSDEDDTDDPLYIDFVERLTPEDIILDTQTTFDNIVRKPFYFEYDIGSYSYITNILLNLYCLSNPSAKLVDRFTETILRQSSISYDLAEQLSILIGVCNSPLVSGMHMYINVSEVSNNTITSIWGISLWYLSQFLLFWYNVAYSIIINKNPFKYAETLRLFRRPNQKVYTLFSKIPKDEVIQIQTLDEDYK